MRHTLLSGLAGLSFALGAPAFAQDTGTAVADPAAQTTPAPAPYEPAPTTYDQAPATTTAADPATDEFPFSGVYVGGSFGYDVQPNDIGARVSFDNGLNGSFGDVVRTGAGADAFSPGFCNGAARGATPTLGCRNDRDGIAYYGRGGADMKAGHAANLAALHTVLRRVRPRLRQPRPQLQLDQHGQLVRAARQAPSVRRDGRRRRRADDREQLLDRPRVHVPPV